MVSAMEPFMNVWKNIEARMAAEEHVASIHRNNEVPDFAFHPAFPQDGEIGEAPRMEEPMWEFLDDEDEEFAMEHSAMSSRSTGPPSRSIPNWVSGSWIVSGDTNASGEGSVYSPRSSRSY